MKMFKNQIVAIVAWFYEYTKNYWIVHFKRVDLKIYELYLNKGAIKKTEWHLRHINKSTEPVTNMVKKGHRFNKKAWVQVVTLALIGMISVKY